MNEAETETVWQMILAGDGFESRIGEACHYATPAQLAAIKHALPEVFERYRPPGIATPPMVEPPHGHDFSYPVEKVTP